MLKTSGGGRHSAFSGCGAGGGDISRVVCKSTSLQWARVHACMPFEHVSVCLALQLISLCQYRLSLVVEVCVVVESSGREPRRPDLDPQWSRFCSSLDTLLEKAV